MSLTAAQKAENDEFRKLKRRMCKSKRRYRHKEDADKQARVLTNSHNAVHPYVCLFCEKWHIGHPNPLFPSRIPEGWTRETRAARLRELLRNGLKQTASK